MAKTNHEFEHCFRDREKNDAICGYPAGMTVTEERAVMKRHPSWYRSTVIYDKDGFLKR